MTNCLQLTDMMQQPVRTLLSLSQRQHSGGLLTGNATSGMTKVKPF
jgi:hypothetical protein